MRRVVETRIEKSKPKLNTLLKGLKGGIKQRVETRQKILDLYEFDEEERDEAEKERKNELRKYMDEGDIDNPNKEFVDLKVKLKKAFLDLKD